MNTSFVNLKTLNPRFYLIVIVLLATCMLFWKAGQANLNDWDEARNGVNAYEMYHNHKWMNLYYNSKPDTWNAKQASIAYMVYSTMLSTVWL